jgi:hypothetical protein
LGGTLLAGAGCGLDEQGLAKIGQRTKTGTIIGALAHRALQKSESGAAALENSARFRRS